MLTASSVTIYGESDDLIEVEGHAGRLEFPCDGKGTVLVVGPSGELVTVTCELGDDWSVTSKLIRGSGVTRATHPRPDCDPGGDEAMTVVFQRGDPSAAQPAVFLLKQNFR